MRVLVCGTRGAKVSYEQVCAELSQIDNVTEILEGCCPDTADVLAERYAEEHMIPLRHFPATSGNYLKRNIEMVEQADMVLAFWSFFSHGTGHVIAHAAINDLIIRVVKV